MNKLWPRKQTSLTHKNVAMALDLGEEWVLWQPSNKGRDTSSQSDPEHAQEQKRGKRGSYSEP